MRHYPGTSRAGTAAGYRQGRYVYAGYQKDALFYSFNSDGKDQRQDRVHEAFGRDYDLPNLSNETYANIGFGMLSWRMLLLTGDAKYADVMERVAYNCQRRQAGLVQVEKGRLVSLRVRLHSGEAAPENIPASAGRKEMS